MQAWVKFKGNPANRQVFYYNNGPGGALSFSVFTNRTIFVTTLGVKDQASNAKIPDDGNWHHIAVVHENKKEFRFYVDGALADTQAYTRQRHLHSDQPGLLYRFRADLRPAVHRHARSVESDQRHADAGATGLPGRWNTAHSGLDVGAVDGVVGVVSTGR